MYAILLNADSWLPAIIRSFMVAGQQAAHIETLNPGEVFMQGLSVALKMLMELRFWSFFYNFTGVMVGLVAALLVIFAFAVIAIEMAVTLIESYIMVGVSAFMLGFAAFRGTASISERFLSMTIGVGLKLFTIYLVIGAGTVLAPAWGALITQTSMLDMAVPFTIAFAAMLYAMVATKIPALAGAMASGAVSMSFHDVLGAATTAGRMPAMMAGPAAAAAVGAGVGVATAKMAIGNAQTGSGGIGGAVMGSLKAAGTAGNALAGAAVPRLNRARENLERSQK
jgi:type IV secretion system protein TrbL